jgi:nitrate reductase gamma subunit
MLDVILFVVFPYVAVALAVGGTIYRYLTNQFSFTSLSSQFLENDIQFWGSTLWHYGIIPTLLIHLAGFAIPKVMAIMHSTPEMLYMAELAGKVMGIMALIGVGALFYRRVASSKIRVVTTPADWVVLVWLIFQIVRGLMIAFF